MFDEINDLYIQDHTFISKESDEESEKVNFAYRFSEDDIIPASTEDKANILRKKLSELVFIKFDGNHGKLEADCAINKDNVMKFINQGKRGRNSVSRNVLGKICVGAQLSIEEAQELFILQGHALDPVNNLFDAIVVCCLKKHDNIYEMIDMCREYNVVIDRSIG